MDFYSVIEHLSSAVWGKGLVFLLLATGVFFTVKLGFPQFTFIPKLIKLSETQKGSASTGLSQFRTVCLSLGTAMGTGNITGVATALAVGGPGAVFWMWVSAFFGMAVVYCENYLALKYKTSSCTGPMAYLKYGVGSDFLAVFFAFFCICASCGMGGFIQVNSFSESLSECVSIPPVLLFILSALLIYPVICGGANRIGSAVHILLPIVTVSFFLACLAVLFTFRSKIPSAFREIIRCAFSSDSAVGGVSGFAVSKAVSIGIRRGVFSNEAGLGSSPLLHCASENSSPQLQGLWSIFEVFFDTIVCCTLTALVLIVSSQNNVYSVNSTFSHVLGASTDVFLALSLGVFAFCTVIGWFYCGQMAFSFVFRKISPKVFCPVFVLVASLGAVLDSSVVWPLADIFNGFMAFSNLAGLLLLANKIHRE